MTRKDYILLANTLRDRLDWGSYEVYPFNEYARGYNAAVEAVISALKSDNPEFNKDRFMEVVFKSGLVCI